MDLRSGKKLVESEEMEQQTSSGNVTPEEVEIQQTQSRSEEESTGNIGESWQQCIMEVLTNMNCKMTKMDEENKKREEKMLEEKNENKEENKRTQEETKRLIQDTTQET